MDMHKVVKKIHFSEYLYIGPIFLFHFSRWIFCRNKYKIGLGDHIIFLILQSMGMHKVVKKNTFFRIFIYWPYILVSLLQMDILS